MAITLWGIRFLAAPACAAEMRIDREGVYTERIQMS